MQLRQKNSGNLGGLNLRLSHLGANIVNRLQMHGIYLNRSTGIAFLIASFTLVASLAAPRLIDDQRLILLIAAMIAGGVAVILLLRWPFVGIAGIIVAALMIPFALGTGTETGINAGVMLLLIMIGLWVIEMVARDKQVRLYASRAVIASLVFSLVAILAFGFGQLPTFAAAAAPMTAQIGGLMIFILCTSAFLVVAHKIQTLEHLKWMTWTLLLVGSLYIVSRFLPIPESLIYKIFVRQAVLGSLFYIWVVAMALSQALFNQELKREWRLGLLMVVAGIFYLNIGISRAWASGWMPALVAAVVVILLARPRYGIWIVIGGIVVLVINSQLTSEIVTEGDNVYSLTTRLEAWKILADIVKVNPIFGVGMSNYYFYTPLYNILGYTNIAFNSHNQYVDLVLQSGLIGLIAYMWFFWEVFIIGWEQRTSAPEGFSRAYVYGVLGGLAGTLFAGLLGDWVVPFVYNIGLEGFRASVLAWMFMGGLLALQQIQKPSGGAGLTKVDG